MEAQAAVEGIPVVGPVVGELLHLLARALGAERILELGTASGYSSIHLAQGLASSGSLLTLERDPAMAERAREHLRRAGVAGRVEVRVGDALEILATLDGPFDLAFLDIEKADYVRALPDCRRLLRPGGLLVADNVGFRDAEPFNRQIRAGSDWRPLHLLAFLPGHAPERDGLCLALRS
jgi:predicted O-methyltransferase YrrM